MDAKVSVIIPSYDGSRGGNVDKIKEDLKKELQEKQIKRTQIEAQIKEALKKSLEEILTPPEFDLIKVIEKAKKESRPAVILIIGYNGSGKSLTCAKLANFLKGADVTINCLQYHLNV